MESQDYEIIVIDMSDNEVDPHRRRRIIHANHALFPQVARYGRLRHKLTIEVNDDDQIVAMTIKIAHAGDT